MLNERRIDSSLYTVKKSIADKGLDESTRLSPIKLTIAPGAVPQNHI